MDNLILVPPTEEYLEDLALFRQELLAANDADSFAGCSGLENFEDPALWIEKVRDQRLPENLSEGKVPSDVYLALRKSDNRIVGIIDLRHHIDHPILGVWGGHIGYIIRPDERGKGFAKEMLRLNLENCRQHGLKKVMITCSRDNPASERTILANGGVFEKEINVDGEFIKRYWIQL